MLFNDSVMWAKPGRRGELRYAGHLVFNRSVRVDRTGAEAARIEQRPTSGALQGEPEVVFVTLMAKDLITMEGWFGQLAETVGARRATLEKVQKARMAAAKRDREGLLERVASLERSLSNANEKIAEQGRALEALARVVETLCQGAHVPFSVSSGMQSSASANNTPRDDTPSPAPQPSPSPGFSSSSSTPYITVPASPEPVPLIDRSSEAESPESARGGSVSPSRGGGSGSGKRDFPHVAFVNADYVSNNLDELSFSFGELMLVLEDLGGGFMAAKPFVELPGDVAAVLQPKRVHSKYLTQAHKKGAVYVTSDSAAELPVPAVDKRKVSGGQGSAILRAVLGNAPRELAKKNRSMSTNDVTGKASPSLLRKNKNSSRTSAVSEAAGGVDHSQEVVLNQGWLWKKGGSRHNWKKRFFFLTTERLYYYETDKIVGKKPLGVVPLDKKFFVEKSKNKADGEFGFQIPLADRLWEFRADNADDLKAWLTVLEALAKRRSPVTPKKFNSVNPKRMNMTLTAESLREVEREIESETTETTDGGDAYSDL